ncbi:MAG TPA: hypothetical protein DDY49_10245 [Paenibacillaceae bacterium]|nr:hypothetical protein [Paenibacillaceae bacterium]
MKRKSVLGIIFLLILGVGAAYYFFGSSPKLTAEETNQFSKEIIKEFNQYFADKQGDQPWYGNLSKSEVTVNQNGEVLLKLSTKDFVKSGDEEKILDAALGFFSESIREKYKVKNVKAQIINPDHKLIEEKSTY